MAKQKSNPFTLPKALTLRQKDLIQSILTKEMTIVKGPAGVGKTYLPAAYAAYLYHTGRVDRIILTRPTVPVGKGIGFLPGTLEEKLEPWIQPILQVLIKHLSLGEVECMIKNQKFTTIPFETIRGHTFSNAFVMLDEAQNVTKIEMKAFLTRLGQDSITVINGDVEQSDLKNSEESGLEYIIDLLGDINNEELADKVGLIEFTEEDCVRSEMCRLWLRAFRQ